MKIRSSATHPKDASVLVVEDNNITQKLIARAIDSYHLPIDYTVVGDGEAATAFVLDNHIAFSHGRGNLPKLIILDLYLPYKDGFEVLECLKAAIALHHINVVMFTGVDSEENRQRAKALKVKEFIVKPYNSKIFFQTIHNMLNDYVTMPSLVNAVFEKKSLTAHQNLIHI